MLNFNFNAIKINLMQFNAILMHAELEGLFLNFEQ